MEIKLLEQARIDLEYWKKTGNKVIMNKITALLKDISEHPYTGIGKPEPLKGDLSGWWSRRIDDTHRIVYKEQDGNIIIASLSLIHISEPTRRS